MSVFAGQAAVVFGAGAGIGRAAAAMAFGADGAAVVCSDVDGAAAHDTAEQIRGTRVQVLAADVADAAAVETVVSRAVERFGQVHAVINCVGITGATGMPSHQYELEEFDRVYAVNLRGALAISQAAIGHVLERGYGVTVNAIAPAVIRTDSGGGVAAGSRGLHGDEDPNGPHRHAGRGGRNGNVRGIPACAFTTGFTFDLSGGRATY